MKKLIIATLLATFAFTSSAFAGDVNVKTDLSQVVIVIGDSTLEMSMENGLATWVGIIEKAQVGEGDFCGFVTRERLTEITNSSKISFSIQRPRDTGGVGLLNTAGIYSLVITKGHGEIIPITFSAFGIGLCGDVGVDCWNLGSIWVSDKESDWTDWESLPEPQLGEEQPPLIVPTEGAVIN